MAEPRTGGTGLEAVLERVTYANEETGYTIARASPARGGGDLVTIVGPLLGAQVGESLSLTGRWSSHPKYGRQFEVWSYRTVLPATVQGIERYLGSGLIKGVGPKTAEKIVAHFGVATLDVIDADAGRLIEVPGLGPKRTKAIAAAWDEQRAIKEVMVFLQSVEVSTSLAVRVYKQYGDAAIGVVKNEPYRLANEVWGIGFKTADSIARAVGIPHDAPERVKAALQYTLSQASDAGHCFLPAPNLVADTVALLGLEPGPVAKALDELAAEGEHVIADEVPAKDSTVPARYLAPFFHAERGLAAGLTALLRTSEDRLPAFADVDWDKAFAWLARRTEAELAPEQAEAVRLALTEKVAVLTGGPGCGKSFTVSSIVALAKAKGAKVMLAAPTGRAAKRLAELTGFEARTLHRMLELRPGGDAAYDRENPLDVDLLVVDESSMLDTILANKLVKAIPPGAHLLLVGDVDQLPSVGAGEVLRDLLAAPAIPRVRLTRIFRQAAESGVVANAHKVNQGQMPELDGYPDFFWFACDDNEQVADRVVEIVAHRIPKRFGIHPVRDVQVLAPMHRGGPGAGNLNARLQEALTPAKEGLPERRHGGRVFRLGDKVIQIRNNYTKGKAGVFNGTVGLVQAIDAVAQTMTVRTDEDEDVEYEFAELDELVHAYAITVHRSQGSEYPAVVIPVTTSAWTMLQRNLIYTAITRAKRLVVLVGSKQALAVAVRTKGTGKRHTGLTHRLGGSSS
ncbi:MULTISPECIES: SF1B family DNA helicase RecD2 [Glycomyces]|uniref:ATP-dependent RecD2 DNA helicase n=1 Tax=Glycomyces lechevalierae TaxID=256034 RepID=A0A9X3SXY9_9ACTN|nr:ATP-dependent RecD-like DNA helicase [Glycomyces lechevalierae]MDA1387452.1 ATP-dependent RecD-like DNA helicase [Glycomyces lechevalierae]MDR7338628.1 exodeoxyribonuclease V alpha subunit [Glycomyces lechevalierae]